MIQFGRGMARQWNVVKIVVFLLFLHRFYGIIFEVCSRVFKAIINNSEVANNSYLEKHASYWLARSSTNYWAKLAMTNLPVHNNNKIHFSYTTIVKFAQGQKQQATLLSLNDLNDAETDQKAFFRCSCLLCTIRTFMSYREVLCLGSYLLENKHCTNDQVTLGCQCKPDHSN